MSHFTKTISFVGLTIAMFMGTLDSTIVNIALPKIMSHFQTSLANTSWVATIYTLALAVFMITAAKIADRYGRKKIMLLGLALFGGFSAACMFANSLTQLIMFRFFQGIGGAIITPIVLPMGIELFGKENMSKIASVIGAVTALAAAGGPPIGGLILEYSSWRWVFGINVPLTILSFLIIMTWVRESYDESLAGHIDFLGTLLLTLGLGGITFALLEGRQYGWQSSIILTTFIGGLVALALFIVAENHVQNPLVELTLFREKTLTASSLVYFLTGFALVSPTLILNYFLQNVLTDTALHAALIIMPVSLTIVIAMPLGTQLFDRVGAIPVTFIGLLILSASLLLLSFIRANTPTAIMITFLIINGIGFGFSSISLVAGVKHLPQNKSGIGSGIINAARQIGTCLGIAILVTVLDTNVNSAKTVIRQNASQMVTTRRLSPQVKQVAHKQLDQLFSTSESNRTSVKTKRSGAIKAIQTAAMSTQQLPKPSAKSSWGKVYQIEAQLTHANQVLSQNTSQLATQLSTLNKKTSQLTPKVQKLAIGNQIIVQNQQKVLRNIALLAQKQTLMTILAQVKREKDQQMAQAFSHTYLLGAVIITILSPIAFWTDRNNQKN